MEEEEGYYIGLFAREDGNGSGSGHDPTHSSHHDASSGSVLFLFVAFAVGALVRHILKHTPIPYTVVLIVVGLGFGAASNVDALSFLNDFTGVANMDPHLMLSVFLPTLIFESAFVMDVHTFKKTIGQAIILAGPGLIMCTFLTALMARYIFTYNWSWVTALLFGSILSATDPVAVVALLKDLGASKQLGTIIEGESLLNDGAAIVLFNVLLYELVPGQSRSALDIFVYFIRVAFGGPAFGYLMAKITIFWLSRVFNDALVEITITLASAYVTFYVGESLLGVSGVLAIVTLGIEINSRRTNISPEVEVFLHRFWGMLGYLANTLIFIIVGVVIAQRAFDGVENIDWMFMFALYIGVMVIRFIVLGGLTPLLMHIGYSIDWKQIIVITWGGLRGAVGLSLALSVVATAGVPTHSIGSKVLFHTAGIVILTLLVNATTVGTLLKALGMSDISHAQRMTMSTAVRRINEAKLRAISMLKSDRFLADAHWEMVDKRTEIDDPYANIDNDIELAGNAVAALGAHSQCPKCETNVPRVPHPKEIAELAEEVRLRMLKAEKTSYWRQFEQGMLGRQAVLALINLADTAMDTPDRLITAKDIEPYWKIPFYLVKIRGWIVSLLNWKSSQAPPRPKLKCLNGSYVIVTHFLFEWILFSVIVVNTICTFIELLLKNNTGLLVLQYFNYVFCLIYIVEAVIKIIGLRQHYFLSKWNIFDFIILIISMVDIVVELSLPEDYTDSHFSPAVIRVVKVLRILRVGRVLRLVKLVLPLLIRLVDTMINRRLRFGYDIGKGFVVGEEEMLQKFGRIGSVVHKNIAQEFQRRAEASRVDVIRSLGLMRKEHPGVALSVKTHHAIRSVLNHCRDTIKQLLGSGLLDESDAEKLLLGIEVKMKRLERTPASLPPPDPYVVLCNVPWLSGLDKEILTAIQRTATLMQFEHGERIISPGEMCKGIYIIVSGLVKATSLSCSKQPHNEDQLFTKLINNDSHSSTQSNSQNGNQRKTSTGSSDGTQSNIDYYGTGTVMGETVILEQKVYNMMVECDTDVQAFLIQGDDLNEVLERYSVVEDRLWRVNGIHMATQLLVQLPEYQDWSTTQLLLLCEGAFIASPPIEPVPTFEILEKHKEVIVVSGEVRCLNTREKLTAPCIVPKNVKYLLMNSGNPKLLVIPTSDGNNESSDTGANQSWLPQYKHKMTFVERLKFVGRKFALFFVWLYSHLMSVVSICVFLGKCRKSSVADMDVDVEEGTEPDHDHGVDTPTSDSDTPTPNSSHEVIDMEPIAGNPITIDNGRVLTPVTPIRGAGPESYPDLDDLERDSSVHQS